MNTWWLRKPTFRRELATLFALIVVLGYSTYRLFQNMVPAALDPRSELLAAIDGVINGAFGTAAEPTLVIPIGAILGLMILISLDHYKYLYGYLLFAATVIGFLALIQDPTVLDPTNWQWGENLPFLAVGVLVGVVGGGLRRDRAGGTDDRSLTHDYLKQRARPGAKLEFGAALPRLLYVLGGLLVFFLFEYVVKYSLSPPALQGFNTTGIGLDVVATGCVLAVLWTVRTYTADTNILLVGASRSGKTTGMAGLGYTAGMYTDIHSDQPLNKLIEEFKKRGFDGIESTTANENIPIQLSFKHGFLFPRRINLRTIDYAGELIESGSGDGTRNVRVPKPADDDPTVTDSFDEAFDVARYMRWRRDREGDESFIGGVESVGINPRDEKFSWPSDVKSGGALEEAAVMQYVVQDMMYYADSIGLVLPMDDFGRYAAENRAPEWCTITRDGELGGVGDRGSYLDVFDKVYSRLGGGEYTHRGDRYQGKGNDVFYLFTFADVAIPSFQDEHEEVAQPATDRPEKFRTHVLEKFIPEYDATKYMGGLYAESAGYAGVPEYEEDNARMVNFDVRESRSETESSPELEDQDHPVLHGTKELLDRLGRRWR